MSVFKCKMCGSEMNIEFGESVCRCRSCGAEQTVPGTDNEKKIALFNRANRLLLGCDFDRAMSVYETIADMFPEEAEAYWGKLMCRYGMAYEDDGLTGEKISVCSRASYDSVLKDEDFELIMEYSDSTSRRIYRREAKQFEDARRHIIEAAENEEVYDIFICCKETDENGNRTEDGLLAQNIYYALTDNGYRVFMSGISLAGRSGNGKEACIFAALKSAKIMLAVGSDYEDYNNVWVKNEWSRFLGQIEAGEKKDLIPCCKNIDVYDIPEEFEGFEILDMGKSGYMQELFLRIKSADNTAGASEERSEKDMNAEELPGKERDKDPVGPDEYPESSEEKTSEEEVIEEEPSEESYEEKASEEEASGEESADEEISVEETFEEESSRKEVSEAESPEEEASKEQTSEEQTPEEEAPEEQTPGEDVFEKEMPEEEASEENEPEEELSEEERQVREIIKKIRVRIGIDQDTELQQRIEAENARHISEISRIRTELEESKKGIENSTADIKRKKREETAEENNQYNKELSAFEEREGKLKQELSGMGIFSGKRKKEINDEIEFIKNEVEKLNARHAQNINRIKKEAELKAIGSSEKISKAEEELRQEEILHEKNREGLNIETKNEIEFGSYQEDEEGNIRPIVWSILKKTPDELLLISKQAIDCRKFNEDRADVTWETCTLRSWLNGEFYDAAFNDAEKTLIDETTAYADRNSLYNTHPGNKTKDRVFLLSNREAEMYFLTDEDRKAVPTGFAISQGLYTSEEYKTADGEACCWWWLRTPGLDSSRASGVSSDGSIRASGRYVGGGARAVRPALVLKLAK